jgi:predicted restriction endonuclease
VKKAVGYRCQLCLALGLNPIGFIKANGTPYVEAHHVMPVHLKQVGSLSCTNVIVLCANHPRQLHYGQDISVDIAAESFVISIEGSVVEIPKVRADVKKADALL